MMLNMRKVFMYMYVYVLFELAHKSTHTQLRTLHMNVTSFRSRAPRPGLTLIQPTARLTDRLRDAVVLLNFTLLPKTSSTCVFYNCRQCVAPQNANSPQNAKQKHVEVIVWRSARTSQGPARYVRLHVLVRDNNPYLSA